MKMLSLTDYAEQEASLLVHTVSGNSIIKLLKIIKILTEENSEVFSSKNELTHEDILKKALSIVAMQPISPITGVDSEWLDFGNDITGKPIKYNKRLTSLIIKGNKYYLTDAVRFIDVSNNNEVFYGEVEGITSSQEVKSFPFTPVYIDVEVARVYKPTNEGKFDHEYFMIMRDYSKEKVLEAYPKS